jgi:uncharacterized protein
MVLADVNLLIHAVNRDSPDHARTRAWWLGLEQSGQIVGLSWITLVAFVRLSTNAKVLSNPLSLAEALETMRQLLLQPNVMVIHPGEDHAVEFGRACESANATANLVTDAHLAALAGEQGCELASCDTDFGKFPDLRWINPLSP